MKVKALCPASCGELLQGMIGTSEKLISYPIDMYAAVTITESKNPVRTANRKKAVDGMYKTLEHFGMPRTIGDTFSVEVVSQIPVAKGMASSTADIAASIVATAALLGKEMDHDALGKLCVAIEPTDSTIFPTLTLFDHLKGIRIESHDWIPRLDVFVLESEKILDTQDFRKKDYTEERLKNQKKVEETYEIFKESCSMKNIIGLGKAATLSALTNQSILPKEKLEEIIESVLALGCCGVNVAHSGTVIGILYDKNAVDLEAVKKKFSEVGVFDSYPYHFTTTIVAGGVKIIERK